MAVTEMILSLASNPYFSAGAGLFGVGSVAAAGRILAKISLSAFRRRYITTLQVPCNDKSYSWLLDWISREAGGSTQHMSLRTEWVEEDGGLVKATHVVEPSPGTHVLYWRGTWIKLDRVREQQQVDVIGGVPWETVTLTTFGRKRKLLLNMVENARDEVLSRHVGMTTTYTCTGSDWRELSRPQVSRPLESVVLPDEEVVQWLADDCKKFLTSGAWYRQRGIPHRRGVLLHGPPGCGKTSLILGLSGHLNLGISILNLSDAVMTDTVLQARVADIPRNTILLLEDIDAAFLSRDITANNKSAHEGQSQVTLTGLLNALDGVVASDGRLTFLTTNYPERLDPALIRPGRVDIRIHVGYCSTTQIKKLFKNFYQEATDKDAENFSESIQRKKCTNISPAQIQAFLLLHRDDMNKAIKEASEI